MNTKRLTFGGRSKSLELADINMNLSKLKAKQAEQYLAGGDRRKGQALALESEQLALEAKDYEIISEKFQQQYKECVQGCCDKGVA